jgi:TolA-binding protein
MKRFFYISMLFVSFTLISQRLERNSYLDAPSANFTDGFFINMSGSYPLSSDLAYGFDPNVGIEFSKAGINAGLNWFNGNDFGLDLAYRFYEKENIALAFGIDNITFSKYISTLGRDTTFIDETYTPRPPEAWSFYVVGNNKFNKYFELSAGIGRGRFVGYGPHSNMPNTDVFSEDKHENFAFGLFLGTKISPKEWIDFILEADGRDINLGVQGEKGIFKGTFSLIKIESLLWERGDNLQTARINANVSFRLPFIKVTKKEKEELEPYAAREKIFLGEDYENLEARGTVPKEVSGLKKKRKLTEDYKEDTPESIKLFLQATELFEAGEYDKARETFQLSINKGLGEYKNEALYRIAECYYNTGHYKKALSIFYRVNSESRDTYLYPESIYGIASCHIALKNWEEAERSLLQLTSEYPGYKDSDKTKVTNAIIAFGKGNYEEVTELLKNIETKEALFYKAKAYFYIEDHIKSLAAFKKLTDEFPESPLARYACYYMGDVLFFSGNYSGALFKYNDFLERYPYSTLKEYASYKLAVCYYNEDNYLKTIETLQPILNSQDIFLAAHSNFLYGKSLKGLSREEEALAIFTKVVSNYPELKVASLANIEMGQVFLAMGDTTQARIVYQQMSSKYASGETIGLGDYLAGGLSFTEGDYLSTKKHLNKILRYYWGSDITCPSIALLLRTYNFERDYELTIALGKALLTKESCEKNDIWKGRAMSELAEAYYQTDQYEDAKNLYQEIIKEFVYSDPELLATAQAGYGWCLLHENRYDITENQFEKVISAYGMDTTALVNSCFGNGIALYNNEEYEKALSFFEGIIKISPDHPLKPKAIFYAGKSYYNLEYYRQAINSWELILEKYRNSDIAPRAAFEIGMTYFQAFKYSQAAPYFQIVIDEYPNSELVPEAMIALGNNYYNGQDYRKAIDAFSKFIELYPNDSLAEEAKQTLSSAYYMSGQENPQLLNEFIEQFPSDPKAALAHYNLAVDLYEKGNKEQALEEFRKVVINFPETEYAEDAQVNVIKIFDERKDYEKLVSEANLFTEYFPDSKKAPLALFYKGSGYFYLGDYGKAIEAFRKIISDYPDSEYISNATYNLDQCYKKLGSTERVSENPEE